MKKIITVLAMCLTGCASLTPPPGQEKQTEFIQEVNVPYLTAYRIFARQMKDCYEFHGLLGNGNSVLSELDSANKSGRFEVIWVGAMTDIKQEDEPTYKLLTVQAISENVTKVTSKAKKPGVAYALHTLVPKWLQGSGRCAV